MIKAIFELILCMWVCAWLCVCVRNILSWKQRPKSWRQNKKKITFLNKLLQSTIILWGINCCSSIWCAAKFKLVVIEINWSVQAVVRALVLLVGKFLRCVNVFFIWAYQWNPSDALNTTFNQIIRSCGILVIEFETNWN